MVFMKTLIGSLIVAMMLHGITCSAQKIQTRQEKDSITIVKLYNKLNDWPNLKHFQEDNINAGLPAANEKRVVFMGNSITQGWAKFWNVFFAGKPYINRGIGGQTSPQMLIRFRADVINLKPKVVVILSGANDLAGNTGPSTLEMIENNLVSMAELAKANGIKVVLCSLLPAYDFPWKKGLEPAEKIIQLNIWIKDYAKKMGFTYVDYHSSLVDARKGLKAEYTADGVHPNQEGYAVMTPIIEKGIAKALKSK